LAAGLAFGFSSPLALKRSNSPMGRRFFTTKPGGFFPWDGKAPGFAAAA
jgi:hypothetical protein